LPRNEIDFAAGEPDVAEVAVVQGGERGDSAPPLPPAAIALPCDAELRLRLTQCLHRRIEHLPHRRAQQLRTHRLGAAGDPPHQRKLLRGRENFVVYDVETELLAGRHGHLLFAGSPASQEALLRCINHVK
jgi:hypothetical protein